MGKKFNPIQFEENDGLPLMDVGIWAQKKYKLVGKYCDIFTSSMKGKWNLIYMDLFCGPGFVKIRDTGQIMRNAGLISMSVPKAFDHYILNDYSPRNMEAMEARVQRLHPSVSVQYSCKDANTCIEEILTSRPRFSNNRGTLTFCFLDPFSLNLDFETMKVLAREKVDILVLHALKMDGQRNREIYMQENHERLARFTGNPNWREKFLAGNYPMHRFCKFLADEFDVNMKKLGYLTEAMKEPISISTGHIIYYLAFYSKHPLGTQFFGKVQRGSNDQLQMF
ncbi:MAG: three-Cys-motif partner protein TcmP [Flavobacteriales bacterium]|nr:three-Cys-motif partner protein TcmP [Flavobacteriales bacterium]MEB2342295.1 three-Cys-motif partner protein TcmP [Flavobacteriia bacterium]